MDERCHQILFEQSGDLRADWLGCKVLECQVDVRRNRGRCCMRWLNEKQSVQCRVTGAERFDGELLGWRSVEGLYNWYKIMI